MSLKAFHKNLSQQSIFNFTIILRLNNGQYLSSVWFITKELIYQKKFDIQILFFLEESNLLFKSQFKLMQRTVVLWCSFVPWNAHLHAAIRIQKILNFEAIKISINTDFSFVFLSISIFWSTGTYDFNHFVH